MRGELRNCRRFSGAASPGTPRAKAAIDSLCLLGLSFSKSFCEGIQTKIAKRTKRPRAEQGIPGIAVKVSMPEGAKAAAGPASQARDRLDAFLPFCREDLAMSRGLSCG